jgi:hypothetical protein
MNTHTNTYTLHTHTHTHTHTHKYKHSSQSFQQLDICTLLYIHVDLTVTDTVESSYKVSGFQILISCQFLLCIHVYVNSQMPRPVWKFCDAILDSGYLLSVKHVFSTDSNNNGFLVHKMKSGDLFEQ